MVELIAISRYLFKCLLNERTNEREKEEEEEKFREGCLLDHLLPLHRSFEGKLKL